MAKLHEVLAVEGDLEGTHSKIQDETKSTFTKKEQHFLGAHRKLEMFNEEDKQQETDEHQEMVTTVKDKLNHYEVSAIRYLDAVLQKEATNQEAKADLVIDKITIARDVPATYLLGLETKLKKVRTVYEAIPTLQPGIKWVSDTQKGTGIYVTVEPEIKMKTQKNIKHKVLYDAVVKDGVGMPAQIKEWSEDEAIGKYTKTIWSGMLSPSEKSQILGRIDKLQRAVKKARQRANSTEVVNKAIGKELFDFING